MIEPVRDALLMASLLSFALVFRDELGNQVRVDQPLLQPGKHAILIHRSLDRLAVLAGPAVPRGAAQPYRLLLIIR
jgi:hypothetical protein